MHLHVFHRYPLNSHNECLISNPFAFTAKSTGRRAVSNESSTQIRRSNCFPTRHKMGDFICAVSVYMCLKANINNIRAHTYQIICKYHSIIHDLNFIIPDVAGFLAAICAEQKKHTKKKQNRKQTE